ncbi:MAG: mannose-1-phosphate guanylyltransferase/mannose-6-phosphate isomerase [Candidatus Moraniibacteriota bacterium]
MYSIIPCGGSGTRLWPLSRKNYPKQFLSLYSDKSLIQETYLRSRLLMPAKNIFLVTDKENFFTAINQLREIDQEFDKDQVLIEPVGMGTIPAMMFAVKHLLDNVRIDHDEQIICLNSDHYIGDVQKFSEVVKNAVALNGDNVGIIGIKPTAPKTGLGYILKGEKINSYFSASAFKEKPDSAAAKAYVDSGKYVWNSGMYLFTAKTFIRELGLYAPKLYDQITKNFDDFIKDYATIPPSDFAFLILEKTKNIAIFEGDFGWKDIGSFDTLAEIGNNDPNKRHIAIDSSNNFVHSDSNRLVVTLGVDNLNIVETTDSILVQKQGHGDENIKKAIAEMKRRNFRELEHNLVVHRPWGKYEVLIESPTHKVKKTTLHPGAKINLQSHYHRTEHWIVIEGLAEISIDGKKTLLQKNESTFVPTLVKHGIENYGKTPLVIIEVQTGDYLGEDDTVTYDKPTILITGGAGFIGSNFANTQQDRYKMVVLDNLAMGDVANLKNAKDVKFIQGDACNLDDLKKCGDHFDYVLHLAGTSTAPLFQKDGFVSGYTNSITSFVQTLEFARKAGARKFIYASTSSLYGNNPIPLTEDQNITPPNHYSVTKDLYENCSRCYNKIYPEIETIGFRFMSIYGPNEEAKGPFANIISQFVWDIMRGRAPIIYGDGTQNRDFTNVADVVQGIALAIGHSQPLGNETFNIGTGEFASLTEISKIINEEIVRQGLQPVEPEYIPNPVKESYVQSQQADIDKIIKVLGYAPSIKLRDGIIEQIKNTQIDKIRKTSSDLLREDK